MHIFEKREVAQCGEFESAVALADRLLLLLQWSLDPANIPDRRNEGLRLKGALWHPPGYGAVIVSGY